MLPDPLHPAVVHFPIVLMFLVPVAAVLAVWAIRRGADTRRTWAIPLAVAAALALSAFVAVRTGEAEEDRVEAVVAEAALHAHEEAAERFLVLSGVLLLVAGAGLFRGDLGRAARLVTIVGSLGLIAAGVQVGDEGGRLVYEHNAGSAYAGDATTAARASALHESDSDD
jgi:uncharacterized membrane protein